MELRAEALTNRRVAATTAYAAIVVGVAAVTATLAASLPPTAGSAAAISLVATTGAVVAALWIRANRWYRRATAYWYSRIRAEEAGLKEPDRIYTAEFSDLYPPQATPSLLDDLVAVGFLIVDSVVAVNAAILALVRL
jgi:hypothetical protein